MDNPDPRTEYDKAVCQDCQFEWRTTNTCMLCENELPAKVLQDQFWLGEVDITYSGLNLAPAFAHLIRSRYAPQNSL